MKAKKNDPLYARIRNILESAKSNVARSVNTTQVIANWLIGREIVEEEQKGRGRADYGERILEELSARLTRDFGGGYSRDNLFWFRRLYLGYPRLIDWKFDALRQISRASRALFAPQSDDEVLAIPHEARGESDVVRISDAARQKSWRPGLLHLSLSWTHYRTLLRVEKPQGRAFYEIEAIKNQWSSRELERQINSLFYERLALSKDKKGLLKLAKKGQEVQKPGDVFKDPVVMEFLGLPDSPKLVETDLEQAMIDNLRAFLLEMGTGFAFVSRQERITVDGDHFYIDLVFYHTILKCFVLIDLKAGKLTHQDLGQLQLYVNYYDEERRTKGDQPTLGLILCTAKNDAVVRYTLGKGHRKNVFASRYRLYVPSEEELKAELRRELRFLQRGKAENGKQQIRM